MCNFQIEVLFSCELLDSEDNNFAEKLAIFGGEGFGSE